MQSDKDIIHSCIDLNYPNSHESTQHTLQSRLMYTANSDNLQHWHWLPVQDKQNSMMSTLSARLHQDQAAEPSQPVFSCFLVWMVYTVINKQQITVIITLTINIHHTTLSRPITFDSSINTAKLLSPVKDCGCSATKAAPKQGVTQSHFIEYMGVALSMAPMKHNIRYMCSKTHNSLWWLHLRCIVLPTASSDLLELSSQLLKNWHASQLREMDVSAVRQFNVLMIDWLGYNGTFSTNRLHYAFEKYVAIKKWN